MDTHPEQVTWRTLAGLLAAAVLIGLVAAPIAIAVGGNSRFLVARLATALVCALVCYRFGSAIRARAGIGEVSEAERAAIAQAVPAPAAVDPLLLSLAAERRAGPPWRFVPPPLAARLHRLSAIQAGGPWPDPPPPAPRLTWQDAARIIARLERGR